MTPLAQDPDAYQLSALGSRGGVPSWWAGPGGGPGLAPCGLACCPQHFASIAADGARGATFGHTAPAWPTFGVTVTTAGAGPRWAGGAVRRADVRLAPAPALRLLEAAPDHDDAGPGPGLPQSSVGGRAHHSRRAGRLTPRPAPSSRPSRAPRPDTARPRELISTRPRRPSLPGIQTLSAWIRSARPRGATRLPSRFLEGAPAAARWRRACGEQSDPVSGGRQRDQQ